MSKLTNVEKNAIQNMVNQGVEVKEIAKQVAHSVGVVEKYIATLPVPEVPTPAPPKPTNTKAKDMMINSTMGKKNAGVSIMTPESSAYSDDAKKLPGDVKSRTAKGAIFKLKEGTIE